MSRYVIPAAIAAMLVLAGCRHQPLEIDTLACERLADWSDRKACLDKTRTQEREWDRRKN